MSGFRATILKMVRNAGVFAWSSAGLVAGGISGHLAMDTESFLKRAQKIEGTVVEVKKTQKVESASEQLAKMTSEQKNATKPADTKQQSDAKQAPPVVTPTPPAKAVTETGGGQTAGKTDPPKPAEPSYVMVVRYFPAQGSPLTIETSATAKIQEGDKIPLLYDPKNPKDARLTATSDLWTGPIALGIAALVTLSIGLLFFVRNRRSAAMPVPDVWLDETKFEFLPFVPGRLETYIGDDNAPLGPPAGITATALAIRDGEAGKYPLVLCEMLAYLSTLAYENKATLEPYLKERYGNAFTNLGFFDRKHSQGFGFLFEETVYIVMRGTEGGKEGLSDWKQNL